MGPAGRPSGIQQGWYGCLIFYQRQMKENRFGFSKAVVKVMRTRDLAKQGYMYVHFMVLFSDGVWGLALRRWIRVRLLPQGQFTHSIIVLCLFEVVCSTCGCDALS